MFSIEELNIILEGGRERERRKGGRERKEVRGGKEGVCGGERGRGRK